MYSVIAKYKPTNDNLMVNLSTLMQVAIGKKAPKHNHHPKVRLHRQDNWKVAHEFMKSAGIYVKGIEPAGINLLVCTAQQPTLYYYANLNPSHLDLGNVNPAAIHNMFINILKWEKTRTQPTVL